MAREQRRLAAIVAADVVGYSRLMGRDESGTLARLRALRRELVDPRIAEHGGRVVKTTGDGLLVEFGSVVDAVRCVVAVQREMARLDAALPEDRRIAFRIGVHMGDIVIDGDDILGDGVNVAARLEALAEPGGVCVSGRVQEDLAGRFDLDLRDGGEQTLKNIARPVRLWRWAPEVANAIASPTPVADAPLALPDKPSIAVLPFQNMSGDPEQEYFADGIAEDIITALARFSWLMVIARNSSFTYKHKSVDLRQVGRELGVRYALEGSVRKVASRVRITAQLVDCATGTHLWADRFDGSMENVFDLQDQVVGRSIGAIEPKLRRAEIERTKRKPTESLDAYDHYLRGLAAFHSNSRQGNDDALRHFLKSVELDPAYAPAYGMAAYCRHRRRVWGWARDREHEAKEIECLARKAAMHGKDDPIALATAGFSLAHLDNIEAGAALIDRACVLNQSEAMAWWMSALVRTWLGEPEVAIEHARRAMRLSPLDPQMHQIQLAIGNAYFISGRYEEAAALALRALHVEPDFLPALRLAATTCGLLGRLEEAKGLVGRLRESFPYLKSSAIKDLLPFRRPGDLAAYMEGLRLAGLPE